MNGNVDRYVVSHTNFKFYFSNIYIIYISIKIILVLGIVFNKY